MVAQNPPNRTRLPVLLWRLSLFISLLVYHYSISSTIRHKMKNNFVFIAHHGRAEEREIILAVSIMLLEPISIIGHVCDCKGEGWGLAEWINTMDGQIIKQANPHLNQDWQWVYLLDRPLDVIEDIEIATK